ncbi:cytochrome c [Sulfitobacter sp. F26169L]|uniref:c-type cytochrome n=1 Tax=Sulfitobacter sp. F26169L TaxID=2996015 RepID=UPI002260EDEF|nr:cytochrome c [Sulfitobacter sp. F26169L]MCX7566304.1 cytochrome c [Sulfitobacter sp. F26169L]
MTIIKPLAPFFGIALLGACVAGLMPQNASVQRGKVIYAKECSHCHSPTGDGAGAASLGLGVAPPDVTGLTARNDGVFPREFVHRFVLGTLEKEDPDAAMPEFGKVGLQHASADGTPAGEVSTADMIALLDYVETIQK